MTGLRERRAAPRVYVGTLEHHHERRGATLARPLLIRRLGVQRGQHGRRGVESLQCSPRSVGEPALGRRAGIGERREPVAAR